MKRRIVACILALAMVLTDAVPVAAAGDSWKNSSFQETIDWLFGHSDEIGYAEISAAAADMKQDYSLLEDGLDGDVGDALIHILDSYVQNRAGNSAGDAGLFDAAVGNSHRQLWEYFQGSVKPYGGNVLKVQPMLQVRDAKETESGVMLSVYEWVYMTYEINGRKDISAHGFDHQMIFRTGAEGWTLTRDLWSTGEGDSFVSKEPDPAGDGSVDGDKDPSEDDAVETLPDVTGDAGDQTDKKDGPDGNGSPEGGNGTEVDNAGGEDPSRDESGNSGEDNPGTDDNAKEDGNPEEDPDQNEGKVPGNDSAQGEDHTSGDDAAQGEDIAPGDNAVPGEDTAPGDGSDGKDIVSGEDQDSGSVSENDVPANNDTAAEQENTLPFPELDKPTQEEPENLFSAIQEQVARFFTPLSTTFSLRTLNYTYSYQDAVAYADKYAKSYNPAYPNCNPKGGDCANFVSQCLHAGGIPMTDSWYSRNGSWTASWARADGLFNFASQNFGTAVASADANKIVKDVTAGNPVFYYSASKGRYSHAAICVGINASGIPVVDAHNNDHLRAVWTLGSAWAKRAVVKINGNGSNSNTEAPPLPPEEVSEGEFWQITASSLNMRSGAGISYAVVGTIPESKVVCVVEKTDVNSKPWGKTTYNGVTGWCSLSYAKYVSGSLEDGIATGVSLNKATATISGIGNTLQLKATITPSGSTSGLTWTSDDFKVATVDSTGLVKAVGDGTAVITAQTTDGSDKTASCIVSVAERPVTAIRLNQTSLAFKNPGSTAQLQVSYTPSSPSSPGVTWKSSNPAVASVDANGKVSALKNGTATITATARDGFSASASCKVNVGKYSVSYKLNGGKNNSKNKSSYYSGDGMKLYNPTRKGYVFGGWYTKKNFTGKITKIAAGKTTNYTLYAKWVKLAKPTVKKLRRNGSGKIKVYMNKKVAGATGFEIQCATNAKFTQGVKKQKTTSVNKTVTGLKKGKRYYVRVRPYIKISSGNYVYGSYSGYRYITVSK